MATTSLIAKKPVKQVASSASPAEAPRFWRVKEDRMVPRKGSGAFLLKKGKEISTPGGYDLKVLLSAGVELIEIDEPAWYTEQQTAARERHQDALDAGLDVGPMPAAHVPARAAASKVPAATEPTS